ncbi:MAG: RtcB family protein [Clostridiales bacterium]|nr:RtcB family protein [Clostridiales bacterium]
MIIIEGAHNRAICYTDQLEPTAREQIKTLCDQQAFSDSKIRIMPDVHAGMGSTIGTTMTVTDKVVPNMVGVDIGCGMETALLRERELDFAALDALIRRQIPSGKAVRSAPHPFNDQIDLSQLRCARYMDLERARLSIGTLGGGNHFIEAARDGDSGSLYLIIHSGSRHLGYETASHYQREAHRALAAAADPALMAAVADLQKAGKRKQAARMLRTAQRKGRLPGGLPRDLAYAQGQLMADYLHDMRLVQRFAAINRQAMMQVITSGLGLDVLERFTTTHNYIDLDSMVLRKGAVSARLGEKLLIPLNMRDGSLLCEGLGNEDWNQSAPHGAGRLMSRTAAFDSLSLAEFRAQMKGVYSTSVGQDTLDEAPMAYKPMAHLLAHLGPTARVLAHLKPLYNFKAAE